MRSLRLSNQADTEMTAQTVDAAMKASATLAPTAT